MPNFEEHINVIESLREDTDCSEEQDAALEAATETLAFVQALHTLFVDSGAKLPETPDCYILEHYIDALYGELGAATIFLSEQSFSQVPDMLRVISQQIKAKDVPLAAPDGETRPSVPTAVVAGFSRFADRIDKMRVQQQNLQKVADLKVAENVDL